MEKLGYVRRTVCTWRFQLHPMLRCYAILQKTRRLDRGSTPEEGHKGKQTNNAQRHSTGAAYLWKYLAWPLLTWHADLPCTKRMAIVVLMLTCKGMDYILTASPSLCRRAWARCLDEADRAYAPSHSRLFGHRAMWEAAPCTTNLMIIAMLAGTSTMD